jgi:hypothetical protein
MAKKIETLTSEQWAHMRAFREQQRASALRTDSIDQDAAKKAVGALYAAAGLKEPQYVFFFQSPLQCLMARGLLQVKGGQLRDQLWGQLGGQLWDQLGDQLRDQDIYQYPYFIGGWDNFWLAFYEFPKLIGVTYSAKAEANLRAYRTYADSCGVSYLYPNVALISDRPSRICFDHLRRLHSDDGPALLYRDGYTVHAWRGQRVNPDWIEKRAEITPKQIRSEKNAELRRVLTEIYAHVHGPGKIIEDMGAKLLSEDSAQGRPRRLYEVDGSRFIHVINGSLEPDGSRREFFLGAETNATTPHEAIAASYGRPARRYAEAVRT